MTLLDLRALLGRALSVSPTPPHIARLGASVSVEDVARAYMPHHLRLVGDDLAPDVRAFVQQAFTLNVLDLTDPGTVHAVLVALCLALGYDCGPMGLYVVFVRRGANWAMIVDESPGVRVTHHFHHISEPDPVRALCLALQWAIERTP